VVVPVAAAQLSASACWCCSQAATGWVHCPQVASVSKRAGNLPAMRGQLDRQPFTERPPYWVQAGRQAGSHLSCLAGSQVQVPLHRCRELLHHMPAPTGRVGARDGAQLQAEHVQVACDAGPTAVGLRPSSLPPGKT